MIAQHGKTKTTSVVQFSIKSASYFPILVQRKKIEETGKFQSLRRNDLQFSTISFRKRNINETKHLFLATDDVQKTMQSRKVELSSLRGKLRAALELGGEA